MIGETAFTLALRMRFAPMHEITSSPALLKRIPPSEPSCAATGSPPSPVKPVLPPVPAPATVVTVASAVSRRTRRLPLSAI
jgi:hypothetical protein